MHNENLKNRKQALLNEFNGIIVKGDENKTNILKGLLTVLFDPFIVTGDQIIGELNSISQKANARTAELAEKAQKLKSKIEWLNKAITIAEAIESGDMSALSGSRLSGYATGTAFSIQGMGLLSEFDIDRLRRMDLIFLQLYSGEHAICYQFHYKKALVAVVQGMRSAGETVYIVPEQQGPDNDDDTFDETVPSAEQVLAGLVFREEIIGLNELAVTNIPIRIPRQDDLTHSAEAIRQFVSGFIGRNELGKKTGWFINHPESFPTIYGLSAEDWWVVDQKPSNVLRVKIGGAADSVLDIDLTEKITDKPHIWKPGWNTDRIHNKFGKELLDRISKIPGLKSATIEPYEISCITANKFFPKEAIAKQIIAILEEIFGRQDYRVVVE